MPLDIDITQVIGWVFLLLSLFASIVTGLFKLLLKSFEQRMDTKLFDLSKRVNDSMKRIESNELSMHELEKQFLRWRSELPMQYVRREDFIRNQTVIEAKLDALFAKVDVIRMRGSSHD